MWLPQIHLKKRRHAHPLLWMSLAAGVICYLLYQRSAGGSMDGAGLLADAPIPGTLGQLAIGMLLMVPWRWRHIHYH